MIGWVRTVGNSFYWTRNGGDAWAEIRLPGGVFAEDVRFATPTVGWVLAMREVPGDPSNEIRYRVAGDHSVYIPALFRTDDGGLTWKQERYPDLKGLPHRLDFADTEHGLSIELNETMFTGDGGRSWHRSLYCANVDTKRLRSAEVGTGMFEATTAQLLDIKYGWWSVEGDLFRTTDGGATWCRLPSIQRNGRAVAIQDIRFANRELGWAVPALREQWPRPAPCFQTQDGGGSWTAIGMPSATRIEGVALLGNGTIYFWGYGQLYLLVR
jgi:photosystem II stability/assembly factor-like uncharacterized protein